MNAKEWEDEEFIRELDAAIERFIGKLELVLDRMDEAEGPPIPASEFRIPCAPGDPVSDDHHKHLCSCGTCWKHSERLSGNPLVSSYEFKQAHRCPSCGSQVILKHGFDPWKD